MQEILNFSKIDNKFPNCVYLKLNGQLSSQSLRRRDKQLFSSIQNVKNYSDYDKILDLKLTIRFGREQIKVAGGSIWFGLNRGELRLKLFNGVIPIEQQGLTTPLENEITLEIQQENANELMGGTSNTTNIGFTANAKTTNKTTSKATYKAYSVSTAGTEHEPIWIFKTITQEPTLLGQISNAALGLASLSSKSFAITATFEIRGQQDVSLVEAEGIWAKNIGRNKLAILEREIFRRYIAPKLKPYLSFMEVSHG
jgi:hypothetical protein